jgi:hypothetical protein
MTKPIDNKTTQKVKETISRMVKSDIRCASVILEPETCEPIELLNTTIARILPLVAAFKSGKTEYMCDGGRVVLLVNYWEPITNNDDEPDGSTNANAMHQYVIIGMLLAPTVHAEFTDKSHAIQTILDIVSGSNQTDGALTIEIPAGDQVMQTYKQPVQLGIRLLQVDAAFKEVDQVVQRFYEYMRRLGLIQDEQDEDMGALADAAGIEW